VDTKNLEAKRVLGTKWRKKRGGAPRGDLKYVQRGEAGEF